MNWRLVGGALIVLALAAGLVVALIRGDEPRAAPPPTEAVMTSTQAPPPAPTTAPPAPVDAEPIWLMLLSAHNWSFQQPDEADLTRYLSADCPCFAPLQERIDLLVANGWHEDDAGVVFDSLEVIAQTDDRISLLVRDRHVELRVVDDAGTLVEQAPARPLTEWRVDLGLEPDGWRITRWDFAAAP